MEDRVKAYLKELAEVSKKHGLFITSCKCCSAIDDEYGKELWSGEIFYDEEKDSY